MKRICIRAIIFKDNNIVAMYREKNGRKYFTFPGGGKEEGETNEMAAIREVKEEFGIDVKVIKLLYEYQLNENQDEFFYLCDWISGELGTGEGEEFQETNTNGTYIPVLLSFNEINKNAPLLPDTITNNILKDFINK